MPQVNLSDIVLAAHEKRNKVTAVGVAEAAASMFTGLGGALAGTGAGVYNAVKEGSIEEYTPAFEAVMEEVNGLGREGGVQYEPKTSGGAAAMHAIESLWTEHITENAEEYLVAPNVEHDNPLIATIGRTSAEALPMFLGFKAGKPIAYVSKKAVKGIGKVAGAMTEKAVNRQRGKSAAAQEALVDIETGKPVATLDAPLSDKGTAFHALSEAMKFSQDTSVSPHKGVGQVLKMAIYKPVQVIRDWKSPTLNKLADAIYAPTKADAAIGKVKPTDLIDMRAKAWGKSSQAFDSIIEPIKGRLNSVPNSVGEVISRGLRTGKAPKKYQKVTLEIREFLDVYLKEYVQPVLPEVGMQKNFLPQVWNVPHMLKHPQRAHNFFSKRMGYGEDGATATMKNIIESDGTPELLAGSERLTTAGDYGKWAGRIMQRGKASSSAFEKPRKINIPEESLPHAEEFLVNNAGDVVHTYLRNAANRVEYARMMGPKEERLNYAVSKGIKELGIEKNIAAIEELTGDIYGLADALQGKYKPIKSLGAQKWNRRVANYETVLHLPLVALASFPEMAAPAIQFGFVPKAYAVGFLHALGEATAAAERVVTGRRTIGKVQAAKALESMGAISLTPLQSITAARFTNISSNFTARFMHATGLELLTDMQRVIAYETLTHVIARNGKALAKGSKKAEYYKGQLTELGIEPNKAIEWVKNGMPEEGHLFNIMENARLRGQRWAITAPTAATKPLIFSDPHFTNILLFKSFTGVFSNLFMKRVINELKIAPIGNKIGMAESMVAAITIAYYTQFLRDMITGRDNDRTPLARIGDALDRSALMGPFVHAYVLVNPWRYGFTDSSAKRLFNLLGPAASDLAKIMDIAVNTEMSKKRRAEQIAQLIPIASVTAGGKEITAEMIEELL